MKFARITKLIQNASLTDPNTKKWTDENLLRHIRLFIHLTHTKPALEVELIKIINGSLNFSPEFQYYLLNSTAPKKKNKVGKLFCHSLVPFSLMTSVASLPFIATLFSADTLVFPLAVIACFTMYIMFIYYTFIDLPHLTSSENFQHFSEPKEYLKLKKILAHPPGELLNLIKNIQVELNDQIKVSNALASSFSFFNNLEDPIITQQSSSTLSLC